MSSDRNSARVARCIDAFRFRTFLDVDCIGASGARAERPDSPAVPVESARAAMAGSIDFEIRRR
ncbi:conserved hypothetical protein [Burkholderia pseudomallei 668]|nr:conserved hypothetical protein [Burkholderia pseudomallei 668]